MGCLYLLPIGGGLRRAAICPPVCLSVRQSSIGYLCYRPGAVCLSGCRREASLCRRRRTPPSRSDDLVLLLMMLKLTASSPCRRRCCDPSAASPPAPPGEYDRTHRASLDIHGGWAKKTAKLRKITEIEACYMFLHSELNALSNNALEPGKSYGFLRLDGGWSNGPPLDLNVTILCQAAEG